MSDFPKYVGVIENGESKVYVVEDETGRFHPLTHHVLHSPDGFSWGYHGSGPTDLAWAMFADAVGEDSVDDIEPFAARLFLDEVVSRLPWPEPFTLSRADVVAWIDSHEDEVV